MKGALDFGLGVSIATKLVKRRYPPELRKQFESMALGEISDTYMFMWELQSTCKHECKKCYPN